MILYFLKCNQLWGKSKSFGQVLNNACKLPLIQLPTSCIKREILEEVYLAGLEDYKNHFHGRVFLNKGDKSHTFGSL